MLARAFLLLEFLLLYIGLPTFFIITKSAPFLFALLWGGSLYGFLVMRLYYKIDMPQMWNWDAVTWKRLRPILIRWVIASFAMLGFLYLYDPDRMFTIIRDRPQLMLMLFFLYPVLSALPQEFIFCTFFFKRYERYFGKGKFMILASAVLFGYAHMLYINPVAPPISFIGGLIFAWDYAKNKSLALVTIEHGLYGNALFFVGLGHYFYSGAVH
jgi:uncharacterized protein